MNMFFFYSDGKVPIHLRLGIANGSDIFDTTRSNSKKSRKTRTNSKNRTEQVFATLLLNFYFYVPNFFCVYFFF